METIHDGVSSHGGGSSQRLIGRVEGEQLGVVLENHRDVARLFAAVARTVEAQGNWEEADRHYETSLAIAERACRDDPLTLAWFHGNRAAAYRRARMWKKALASEKEARRLCAETLGEDHQCLLHHGLHIVSSRTVRPARGSSS